MSSSQRKGFTLIELLVVIAIIALLAAILFPAFSRARENARRASCSGNMRQIGLGLMQYIQDYDDFLPGRSQGGIATLQNTLQPYIKSYQVFQCPSNSQNNRLIGDDITNMSHVSYAPNTRGVDGTFDNGGIFAKNSPGDTTPVNSAAITVPSTTIALCEVNGTSSDFNIAQSGFATMTACSVDPSVPKDPCLSSHHLTTANYLFADGHVKALQPAKTLSPVNLWNRLDNAAYTGAPLSTAQLIIAQSQAYSK